MIYTLETKFAKHMILSDDLCKKLKDMELSAIELYTKINLPLQVHARNSEVSAAVLQLFA